MKILVKTKIFNNYKLIFSKFDIELFKLLKPPFVNLTVTRFDGCKTHDQVHLKIDLFGKLQQTWISHITDNVQNEKEIYFVDIGFQLPPPLKKWKHVHRIEKIDDLSSMVIDDIDYTTGNPILDIVIYPALYLMFAYRIPIYKKSLHEN